MNKITVGLIGNPNCGKTTVFNALTGSRQRVGNWPGVTVERKSGTLNCKKQRFEIVDLPGVYSLSIYDEKGALDEKIAAEYILSDQANLIVNVVDANNLERNLYLTTQLLELKIPLVLAVNMLDIAEKHGKIINLKKLSSTLGCQVVGLVSNKKEGIKELIAKICESSTKPEQEQKLINYPSPLKIALSQLTQQIDLSSGENKHGYFMAARLLEGDVLVRQNLPSIISTETTIQKQLAAELNDDTDILIADARYGFIHNLVKAVAAHTSNGGKTFSNKIDKIILSRTLGIPIFLIAMYLMFLLAIGLGGKLQVLFQAASNAVFIHGLGAFLTKISAPLWLSNALTAGIGKGVGTTITFIPVLALMFLALAILEDSGYMARAGFVVDRFMQAIGLPGKSFVPMLIGFGCNVPAIMAARTLRNNNERILTIMMTPFMSCGARLAVYAIFAAAFFPKNGQNIVFALYLIGITLAVLSGLLFKKTILAGERTTLITELPSYHAPTLRGVSLQTWCRLKNFILKAGKIIVPVCLLISLLSSFSWQGQIVTNYTGTNSALATIGKTITPIFKPIGITKQNWPATVGLLSGIMAKEVVVGSLNTLYAKPTPKTRSVYGNMYKKFGSLSAAFAYLLFVLLYFPCIPTLITMKKELNWRWALFSLLWNTGIAYLVAMLFYQLANLL